MKRAHIGGCYESDAGGKNHVNQTILKATITDNPGSRQPAIGQL